MQGKGVGGTGAIMKMNGRNTESEEGKMEKDEGG